MIAKARLALFAAVGGALTGLISFAFLRSLDWATNTRVAHGWLVWLLPAVGLLVGATYHSLGGRAKGGTPAVIEQGHMFTHGVPARMAPLIFGGSAARWLRCSSSAHTWWRDCTRTTRTLASAGHDWLGRHLRSGRRRDGDRCSSHRGAVRMEHADARTDHRCRRSRSGRQTRPLHRPPLAHCRH